MLTCTVGRSQPHGSQSQPHEAREGLVVLHPPYVPMADALDAWRHVSSHTPGRVGSAFGKGHQTICQLEGGRIHRQRRLARPSRSLPTSVAMRVWGELGRGISVVNASRDGNGPIVQHAKSARPPANPNSSIPSAPSIPFTLSAVRLTQMEWFNSRTAWT